MLSITDLICPSMRKEVTSSSVDLISHRRSQKGCSRVLRPFLFEDISKEGFNRLFHSPRGTLSQGEVFLPFWSRFHECSGIWFILD